MNLRSASYIYIILILGSGYSVLSTLINYFFKSYTVPPNSFAKIQLIQDQNVRGINTATILSRNIFNIEGTIPRIGQLLNKESQCPGIAKHSSLPYEIVGILYGGSSKTSVAVLQNKNVQEEILILKKNSKLPKKGYVSNIDSNRIWIVTEFCPEYLEISKAKLPPSRVRHGNLATQASDQGYSESGFERVGNNTNVTREWVDDILTNKLADTLGDALATPNVVDGATNGFVISQIEPMSVYDKFGLKNGDIVTAVNGVPLNDAGQAIQTLTALKNEREIELQVMRNGQITTFRVNVQQ